VAYPHYHIRILPITSAAISAVFLRILPLRRSTHPQIAHPHFTGAHWRRLHRPRTAFIPVVNHTLALNSRKCLTYYRIGLHCILLLLLLSLLQETPLFHAAVLREYYKAPLTGRYTVILSVGDNDIGLILLLWRPNLCWNRKVGPYQKFSKSKQITRKTKARPGDGLLGVTKAG